MGAVAKSRKGFLREGEREKERGSERERQDETGKKGGSEKEADRERERKGEIMLVGIKSIQSSSNML